MTSDIKAFFDAHPEEDVSGHDEAAMDRYMQSMSADMAEAHAFAEANGIPFISAVVIVRDRGAAERSKRWVQKGLDARVAMAFVGSYARLDFALWAVENGHMDRSYLLDVLPDLWRGSDPDDTDPRFHALWLEAFHRNGDVIVTDLDLSERLPSALRKEYVTVYRGELGTDDPRGIAWSLDPDIAAKFAKTGGLRGVIDLGGTIHVKRVPMSRVLGYLHHRGEAEVVIDPGIL